VKQSNAPVCLTHFLFLKSSGYTQAKHPPKCQFPDDTFSFEGCTLMNIIYKHVIYISCILYATQVVHRKTKNTEKQALYKMNFDHPKYLNFYNEQQLTATGQRPGYRIQLNGALKELYPESLPFIQSAKWSLHQMVVTKYKENETRSSSLFNQADPYDPDVDFEKFYADDESIRKEDLVAWVTIGVMHMPHTEDVPNTATAGNTASFFLRPYNYFEEDPSMRSRDAVLIEPKEKFSGINVNRFGTPEGPLKCIPDEKPLEYTGTYGYA